MDTMPFPDTEFSAAWAEFLAYRKKEKKDPLTEFGINRWFKWFVKHKFTSAEAIECINNTMDRGWIGLFDHRKYKPIGNKQTGGTSIDRLNALENW